MWLITYESCGLNQALLAVKIRRRSMFEKACVKAFFLSIMLLLQLHTRNEMTDSRRYRKNGEGHREKEKESRGCEPAHAYTLAVETIAFMCSKHQCKFCFVVGCCLLASFFPSRRYASVSSLVEHMRRANNETKIETSNSSVADQAHFLFRLRRHSA